MKPQAPTELPFGYDERTELQLTADNDIVITHPVMPPMIYDETVMRWVHRDNEFAQQENNQ